MTFEEWTRNTTLMPLPELLKTCWQTAYLEGYKDAMKTARWLQQLKESRENKEE
jgi:hypothetical protein